MEIAWINLWFHLLDLNPIIAFSCSHESNADLAVYALWKWDQMAHNRIENQHSNFDRIKKKKERNTRASKNVEDGENLDGNVCKAAQFRSQLIDIQSQWVLKIWNIEFSSIIISSSIMCVIIFYNEIVHEMPQIVLVHGLFNSLQFDRIASIIRI